MDGDRLMAAMKIPVAALVLIFGFVICSWDRNKNVIDDTFMKRFYRRRTRRSFNSTRTL
ncbi:MAG: hypothetical protein HPY50_04560 [Firmicutes bacterium]|nr:hypothetical protein [Bacillota bacterium]